VTKREGNNKQNSNKFCLIKPAGGNRASIFLEPPASLRLDFCRERERRGDERHPHQGEELNYHLVIYPEQLSVIAFVFR
jgi:hypothetical protein